MYMSNISELLCVCVFLSFSLSLPLQSNNSEMEAIVISVRPSV